MIADLDGLFNPRSIAVIGASSNPRKISGRPIQLLKRAKFAGPIYPINPRRSEVQGLPAHPDLASIQGPVDQALICLPAAAVLEAAQAAIAKGVRSIVVFSAGFSETGAAGAEAQARLAARCAEAGVSLLGPNCLGAVSFGSGTYSTFSHSLEFAPPEAGAISMASQSGAVGSYVLVKGVARGLKFARMAATGNEADIDVAACVAWFSRDPATKVILAYLESCKDGRRLVEALEQARVAGKPVIVLKAGSSTTGSRAAASHTGALAGTDAVYGAAFAAGGAARVSTFDEMLDLAYLCAQSAPPAGRRLGVVTVSGGFGVMIADEAASRSLELPPLPFLSQQKIKEILSFASPTNPIDVTPQLLNNFDLLAAALAAMLEEERFDVIAVFVGTIGLDPQLADALIAALLTVRERFPEKLLSMCMMTTPDTRRRLEAIGLTVFEDPDRLVRAISRLAHFRHSFGRPPASPTSAAGTEVPLPDGLSEAAAKALLGAAGVPFPPEVTAKTAAQAVAAARAFDRPVALKVAAAGVAHKSDIGGVLLNLRGDDAVARGFETVTANVRKACPEARVEGVLVAPMIVGGIETIIGIKNDPSFGPVVMFGLGGVYAEALNDVIFRLAPVVEDEALAMIRQVRGYPVLAGARGRKAADLDAISRAIAALSRFAVAHQNAIESIDINPFIALPDGGVAIDALIVTRGAGSPPEATNHG